MDPIVIDPPGFDMKEAWQECRDYVDQCGGLQHEDGEPNWRAAFGADPGVCSCPSCREHYWSWGRAQRCRKCGFEYPTDAWCMYSWGVQAGRRRDSQPYKHEERMQHPYYRYGFENPVDSDVRREYESIDWREAIAKAATGGAE